jgi:voltage-gated potassium channel
MYNQFKTLTLEMKQLLRSPFFLLLTVIGNGVIGSAGVLFYYIESPTNPKVTRLIDAIWWAFATATTTGYGDITPATDAGKILGILLMLMGLALFSMFTALVADTILTSSRR